MELKNINKKNLMEGKRKVEEERMNAEVKEAADQYREIVDSMDSLKRERKIINEQLEEYEKELKIFKEKWWYDTKTKYILQIIFAVLVIVADSTEWLQILNLCLFGAISFMNILIEE